MDVLNRLLPRHGTSNGGGFKRLKHGNLDSIGTDNLLAIGGTNPNSFDSSDGDDQFALIPANDSSKVELGLVLANGAKQQQQQQKEKQPKPTDAATNGTGIKSGSGGKKMPWNSRKENAKSASKDKSGKKEKRDTSCMPNIPSTNPAPANNANAQGLPPTAPAEQQRSRRTLIGGLGSLLPGGPKKLAFGRTAKGRMNSSASEPQLNFLGSPKAQSKFTADEINYHYEEDEEDPWEGRLIADPHRMHKKDKEALQANGQQKGANDKPNKKPMFQKVRAKFSGKLGTTAGTGSNLNRHNSSSGISSDYGSSSSASSSSNSSSSASSTPPLSASASSKASNGMPSFGNGINRMMINNGFNNNSAKNNMTNGHDGHNGQLPTKSANGNDGKMPSALVKQLRKQAKIMDIMGKKSKDGTSQNGHANGNGAIANSRKPVDAQHLLLFEEGLAMD